MTAAQFQKWQARMGLSNSRAGTVLCVNKRQIAKYRAGDGSIPAQAARLCDALELLLTLGKLELPPAHDAVASVTAARAARGAKK